MIGAAEIRTCLALQAIKPFDRLTASELLLVARHMRLRRFEPGTLLVAEGTPSEMLFATLAGEALAGGMPAGIVFDAASVLFALPAPCDYRAGPAGLEALCLAKSHLFTIARECPDFIIGLVPHGGNGGEGVA